MTLERRIAILHKLGEELIAGDEFLDALIKRTFINNQWLTEENLLEKMLHLLAALTADRGSYKCPDR